MKNVIFKVFLLGGLFFILIALSTMAVALLFFLLLSAIGLILDPNYFQYSAAITTVAGLIAALLWFGYIAYCAKKFFFEIIKNKFSPEEKK